MKKIFTVNRQIDGITRSAIAAYEDREGAEKAKERLSKGDISSDYQWVVDEIPYYDKDHK